MSYTESVWDYPRPPVVELSTELIKVVFNGRVIAESSAAYRVLETSHPPAYYIPPEDVIVGALSPVEKVTFCEYKGAASYCDVMVDARVARAAAWRYLDPAPGYEAIRGYLAFYPAKMDECWVGEHLVEPQSGSFYGGWITPGIVGPFKAG